MNATLSLGLDSLKKILDEVKSNIQSETLQEKINLDSIKMEIIRECLEEDNFFTFQKMLSLKLTEYERVLNAVAQILGIHHVCSIAFVNEFDSDGTAYAMVHIGVDFDLK